MEAALIDYMNWYTSKAVTKSPMPESVRLAEIRMNQEFEKLCEAASVILPRPVIDLATKHRVTEVGATHLVCLDFSRFTHDLDEVQRRLLHMLMVWRNTPLRILIYKRNITEFAKTMQRIGAAINAESNVRAARQGAKDMKVAEAHIYSITAASSPPTTAVSMNLDSRM